MGIISDENFNRAKVRAVSYIVGLCLLPITIILFMLPYTCFVHFLHYKGVFKLCVGEIFIWIKSLVLFILGIAGLKGLFERKFYGKWMISVFGFLLLIIFISSAISDHFAPSVPKKSGIFYNRLDEYKIVNLLFDHFSPLVLLSLITIILPLTIKKDYFERRE